MPPSVHHHPSIPDQQMLINKVRRATPYTYIDELGLKECMDILKSYQKGQPDSPASQKNKGQPRKSDELCSVLGTHSGRRELTPQSYTLIAHMSCMLGGIVREGDRKQIRLEKPGSRTSIGHKTLREGWGVVCTRQARLLPLNADSVAWLC